MSILPASIFGIALLISFSITSSATAAMPLANYEISTTTIHVSPADESDSDESNLPCDFAHPYLKEILVRDLNGNIITQTTAGSQVVIEAIVNNDCQRDWPPWALIEVRDEAGVTNYISWQVGTPELHKQTIIDNSWVAPDVPGKYEVRGFGIGCLQCPMILSNVFTYELTVLPAN